MKVTCIGGGPGGLYSAILIKARFPDADAWQVSASGRKDFMTPEGIRLAPALELLRTLV